MFSNNGKLEITNSIDNWNIKESANFNHMFTNNPSHPEFTKVPGTWNNGTFTPNS